MFHFEPSHWIFFFFFFEGHAYRNVVNEFAKCTRSAILRKPQTELQSYIKPFQCFKEWFCFFFIFSDNYELNRWYNSPVTGSSKVFPFYKICNLFSLCKANSIYLSTDWSRLTVYRPSFENILKIFRFTWYLAGSSPHNFVGLEKLGNSIKKNIYIKKTSIFCTLEKDRIYNMS